MNVREHFLKLIKGISDPVAASRYFRRRLRDYRWEAAGSEGEYTKNISDFKFELNLDDNGVSKSLYLDEMFEPAETSFYENTIHENDVIADVGANIGYFTVLFAKYANDGTVYSFEPEDRNFSILQNNIEMNNAGNVVPEQVALSSQGGSIELYLHPTNAGGHSIHTKGVLPFDQFPEDGQTSKVESITFDQYFSQKQIDVPDFVKIDVEGGEPDVLYGMKESLQSSPVLVFEFTPHMWTEEPKRVFAFLDMYGYDFYEIQDNGGVQPINKNEIVGLEDGWYDIVCAEDNSVLH